MYSPGLGFESGLRMRPLYINRPMASKVLYQDDLEVGQTSTAGTVGEATCQTHLCPIISTTSTPANFFL